jgi:hypothetical protein
LEWSGEAINLEKSHEWINLDISEAKSVSINDVNGDGKKEKSPVVIRPDITILQKTQKISPELNSRSGSGMDIIMEKSFDCRADVATLAWNVETADLDNDGIVEIIIVGCMETENLLDCTLI